MIHRTIILACNGWRRCVITTAFILNDLLINWAILIMRIIVVIEMSVNEFITITERRSKQHFVIAIIANVRSMMRGGGMMRRGAIIIMSRTHGHSSIQLLSMRVWMVERPGRSCRRQR